MQFLIACSRNLLDWVVRDQVLTNSRITVREATDVLGLTGDPTRVTGVQVHDQITGTTRQLDVDLVVGLA
jgi:alkyl hydroperoxide reductase subunit AhpF